MPGFHLTQAAKTDLKDIGRYTQNKWGRAQRDKYLAMLDGCFQDLADEPLKGRDCSDIRDGYRKYSAGRHVIYYHPIPINTLLIARILHDRMDVERHLSDS